MSFDDQAYIEKFGKVKSDLLDSWLEMSNDSLIKECQKVNLLTTGKHIENMQKLFDYLKKFDQEILNRKLKEEKQIDGKDSSKQQQSSSQGLQNQTSNYQGIFKDKNQNKRTLPNDRHSSNQSNSWYEDVEKAQASLDEDIDRIFGRNAQSFDKNSSRFHNNSEQSFNRSMGTGKSYQAANTPIEMPDVEVYTKTTPPVFFDLNKIISGLDKRGNDLTGTLSSSYSKGQKLSLTVNPNAHQILFQLEDNQLVERFLTLLQDESSLISKMTSLSVSDFKDLSFNEQRKILLSIEHLAYKEKLATNDPTQAKIDDIINNLDKENLELSDLTLVNIPLRLVEIARDSDPQKAEKIKNLLFRSYLKHQELIYSKDFNLLKEYLQHSRIISYLIHDKTEDSKDSIAKIKNDFVNSAKKVINRRNIAKLNFEDKYYILNLLPDMTGTSLYQSQRSFNYLILNEMLTDQKYGWEGLQKEKIFNIVQKSAELEKCRDLQNKVRAHLTYINTNSFNMDDFRRLTQILSEGKDNHIDVRLITQLITRRSIKSFAFMADSKEFSKFVDFFQYLYKTNPLLLSYISYEMKYILFRASSLVQREYVKFNDMIKLSSIMVPSLYKPAFFFNEMIKTPRGSFKKEADKKELLELVSQITLRIGQGDMKFEHLNMSNSRLHKNYTPYSEETFILLQKILSDLIYTDESQKQIAELSPDELRIANKIFSCEPLMLKLFRNAKQVIELTEPVINNQLSLIKQQLQHYQSHEEMITDIDIEKWEDIMKSISNIQVISQSSQDLVQKSYDIIESSLQLLNYEIIHQIEYKLDDLFRLNQAVLIALSRYPVLIKQYQEESPLAEVIKQSLDFIFYEKKPFISKFDKTRKNFQIVKAIQSQANQSLVDQHIGSLINFLKLCSGDSYKALAINLIKNIKNARSLMSEDLINLFQVIDKYSITNQAQNVILNVAPNLMTVDKRRILTNQLQSDQQDVDLQREQIKREQIDEQNKQMIYNKYYGIFMSDNHIFEREEVVLGPLSYLLADIFNNFSDQEILEQLKLLGGDKIDNYHSRYIKKLYSKYSQLDVIEKMHSTNPKVFYEFAKHWPHFLKNNAILNILIQNKNISSQVTEQAESLYILTKKNVLHPELIDTHFETFLRMKDKNLVSKYLRDFMFSCSYLGYQNTNMEKLTQVFRRIYKTPDEVEISDLLNYLIMLSLSKYHYLEFDEKSIKFVKEAISLIDQKYTGIEVMKVKKPHPVTGEIVDYNLDYYKPISTENKVYNKVIIKAKEPKLDFQKAFENLEDEESSSDESAEETQENLSNRYKLSEEGKSLEEELDKTRSLEENDEFSTGLDKLRPEINDDEMTGLDDSLKIGDRGFTSKTLGEKADMPIYERKASEGLYSEELEFHQYRKKKIATLDKKSKHLLLFSNINQLNFVDINQSDIAKAWAVLFHFESKSLDSVLYDEFESIAMRNAVGKNKGHELYYKFYNTLIEKSYINQLRVNLTTKCNETGWPIDVIIQPMNIIQKFTSSEDGGFGEKNSGYHKQLAIYFFLQEEVCFNAKTGKDEPLALQKLMLKHLSSVSDYKIDFVTENNFYSKKKNKQGMDQFVNDLLAKNFDMVIDNEPHFG